MNLTGKVIWRTQKDTQVCPICKALDGYTWTIKLGEPYPKKLVHPIYGAVYDTRLAANGSLVKEENGIQCRCTIEHQLDLSEHPTCEDCTKNQNEKQIQEQQPAVAKSTTEG
jgi:hypothetical protein